MKDRKTGIDHGTLKLVDIGDQYVLQHSNGNIILKISFCSEERGEGGDVDPEHAYVNMETVPGFDDGFGGLAFLKITKD